MNIFDRELLKAAGAFFGLGQTPPVSGPVGPVRGTPPASGPKMVTPGARAEVKSRLAEKLGPRMQPDVFGKGTEPSTAGKAPVRRPVPAETRQDVEKTRMGRRVKELEAQKAEQAKGKESRVAATKERRASSKTPVPTSVLPDPAAASGSPPADIFNKSGPAPVRTQASPASSTAPTPSPAPVAPPVANTAVPGSEAAPAQPAAQPAAQPGAAPWLNWKRKLMLGGGLAAGAGLYAGYQGVKGLQRGSAEGEEERRRSGLP